MASDFNQVQYLQPSLEPTPVEHLSGFPPTPTNIRPGWKDLQWKKEPTYSAISAAMKKPNKIEIIFSGK
jgi:hypothetical protein